MKRVRSPPLSPLRAQRIAAGGGTPGAGSLPHPVPFSPLHRCRAAGYRGSEERGAVAILWDESHPQRIALAAHLPKNPVPHLFIKKDEERGPGGEFLGRWGLRSPPPFAPRSNSYGRTEQFLRSPRFIARTPIPKRRGSPSPFLIFFYKKMRNGMGDESPPLHRVLLPQRIAEGRREMNAAGRRIPLASAASWGGDGYKWRNSDKIYAIRKII